MKTRMLAAGLAFLVVFPILANAQAGRSITVEDLAFPFTAGKASFPAGPYKFSIDLAPGILRVTNTKTGQAAMVTFITRLSSRTEKESVVVFDRVGDKYTLSEVYLPDTDGFCLAGTTSEHTHARVVGK